MASGYKTSREDIAKWLDDRDCRLITEEIRNTKQKIDYECGTCGKVHTRTFDGLKSSNSVCDRRSLNGPPNKLSEDQLREKFASYGCEYIETVETRKSGTRYFRYRCHCGNIAISSLKRMSKRVGCDVCYRWLRRKPFDDVKRDFDRLDLDLHSTEDEYENNMSILRCSCRKCGFVGETTYGYVQDGRHPCGCGWRRGADHYLYNPDLTDEQRRKRRLTVDYVSFRRDTYERDHYLCRVCGKRGGHINAHHLYNFADYPALRIEVLNAVTLCVKCHSQGSEVGFHRLYGLRHNTLEQFEEYRRWRRHELGIDDIDDGRWIEQRDALLEYMRQHDIVVIGGENTRRTGLIWESIC